MAADRLRRDAVRFIGAYNVRKELIDRLGARVLGFLLAISSALGWAWFSSYQTKAVDIWEPPILTVSLLIAAFTPARIALMPTVKPLAFILVGVNVLVFIWWLIERSMMDSGFDIGGAVLRLVDYGAVAYLLLPRQPAEPKNNPVEN